ncbi:MAG: MarR family transcriptional regulator [Microbacteriaceae bacterium]|nr:MarR family transcriptional regulator [Microbacteriaceae bacterium]
MSRSRSFTPEERETWVPVVAMLELLPKRLDTQLQRDEDLTHFDFFVLSLLALDERHMIRMSALASMSNATLPRLSHVVTRLERRGFVRRLPTADDARATDVALTSAGRLKVIRATPGHVENVRRYVLDALEPEQQAQLRGIAQAVLERLDPEHRMAVTARTRPRR